MDSTTINSMCRCCAAEGIFKDIKTSYHWMGEEEVYGDMLRECFDVKLVSVEEGGICEVCITQLRNASNFKKQVLHTEKKFKRHLESRRFKPTEVKEEVSGDEHSSSEDNENDRDVDNDNIDDEDYVPDFEIPIKTESPEDAKSRKRAAKATTSRGKKSRAAEHDDEDKSLASKRRQVKATVSTNKSKVSSRDRQERSNVSGKSQKDTRKRKHKDDDVIYIGVSKDSDDVGGKRRKNDKEQKKDDDKNSSKKRQVKTTVRTNKSKENADNKEDRSKVGSQRDKRTRKQKDDDVIFMGVAKEHDKADKSNKNKKERTKEDDKKKKDKDRHQTKNKRKDRSDKNIKVRDGDKTTEARGKIRHDNTIKRKDDGKTKDNNDDKLSKHGKGNEMGNARASERKEISDKNDDTFEIHTRSRKDDEFLEVPLTELDKHLHNIRTILLHSTATPIQNHTETGFVCGFCVAQFITAAELKTHSLQKHGEEYINRFMGGHNIYSYVVKLDITSLRCTLCARKIYTLELLMDHLETKHEQTIHRDIPNHILPFKFQSDTFSCVICDRKFDRFKQMQAHMSTHYRNYECNDCSSAFINKATLRTHWLRHKTGIFNCHYCTKCFDTNEKLINHEKFVHVADHKRNKCGDCGEFFTKYTKKMQHMVEVHGHQTRVVKCMACEKTFSTKEKLTKHNKRDHLLERNYKCDVCGSGFFDNYDLRRHLRTHGDAKPFTCHVCNKGFNRKDNMLEHARIHTGEHKRFSCDRCGQNFSHMARLRRHTALRHKELLDTLDVK